jgi:hypothetical protein
MSLILIPDAMMPAPARHWSKLFVCLSCLHACLPTVRVYVLYLRTGTYTGLEFASSARHYQLSIVWRLGSFINYRKTDLTMDTQPVIVKLYDNGHSTRHVQTTRHQFYSLIAVIFLSVPSLLLLHKSPYALRIQVEVTTKANSTETLPVPMIRTRKDPIDIAPTIVPKEESIEVAPTIVPKEESIEVAATIVTKEISTQKGGNKKKKKKGKNKNNVPKEDSTEAAPTTTVPTQEPIETAPTIVPKEESTEAAQGITPKEISTQKKKTKKNKGKN